MTTDYWHVVEDVWMGLCGAVYDGNTAGDPPICTKDAHLDTEKHREASTGFEWW